MVKKSGKAVLTELRESIGNLETEQEKLSREVYNYDGSIEALVSKREKIFGDLAFQYLPEMEADALKRTLSEVSQEVQSLFKKKQERRLELDKEIDSLSGTRKDLELKLKSTDDTFEKEEEEKDELAKEVRNDLNEDERYTSLIGNAEKEKARITQNKLRVKEAKNLAQEKLPEYENNKLFSYLINAGYGTPEYRAGSIRKRLDSRVANIINYKDNKLNYDFLTSMPKLMEAKVKEREHELETILKLIEEIEGEVAEEHGLTKKVGEIDKLTKKRNKLISELEDNGKAAQVYSAERTALDGTKDPYHQQALGRLKDYLKGKTIYDLKELASSTRTREDDDIVQSIGDIDSKIKDLKSKAKLVINSRDEKKTKLDGLRTIETEFSRRNYNSSRSYFDGEFDLNTFIIGYLAGSYSHSDILDNMGSHRHLKPEESYSYSSSSSSSSSSHSSSSSFGSGSGFGGSDSFSSGGGFGGGGGFSSGSGF